MKYKITIIWKLALLGILISSCKKLVDIDAPKTGISSLNIYENDVTATSVLTSIYTNLSATDIKSPRLGGICYFTGLSSDELRLIDASNSIYGMPFYVNALNSQIPIEFWDNIYGELYVVNSALEGVSGSTTLNPKVKQQLYGEAKFMRAFCFFYLVNLYGDVPLTLSTDYKKNTLLTRSPKTEIWAQIISDLKDAQSLLSPDYLNGSLLGTTEERVRPTQAAATALLARAYLYTKNWEGAEKESTKLLQNPAYQLVDLNQVFLKNSKEAIWQLQPVSLKGQNASEALGFVLDQALPPNINPTELSQTLLNSFESGDQRKFNWVGNVTISGVSYAFPYKYKKVNFSGDVNFPVEEYSTVLRLAEQCLIRAEARIERGNIVEGVADLNRLRDRATDKFSAPALQLQPLKTSLSKEDALFAVEQERRVELFTEWGHRWLDLKRTARVDEVMALEVPKKAPNLTWKSYQQWYPIKFSEINRGPNLVQNEGY